MASDAAAMRNGTPFVFTTCTTGDGTDEVISLVRHNAMVDRDIPVRPGGTTPRSVMGDG